MSRQSQRCRISESIMRTNTQQKGTGETIMNQCACALVTQVTGYTGYRLQVTGYTGYR